MAIDSIKKTSARRSAYPRTIRWSSIAAIALIASLLMATIPAEPARAQLVATSVPAVTVYGTGEASAPAATATVQFLLGLGERQFGFSSDSSGGMSRESSSESVSSAGEEASEGRRENRRSEPQTITPEQVESIVAALAEAAGVEPDAVQTHLSPLAARQGEGRARNLRLELVVDQPTPEGLTELLAATSDAAAVNGLVVEVAGARYDPADCATIEEAAEEAAIADAELHAERLARLLGVTLGGVVGAASNDYSFALEEDGGCRGQTGSSYDSQHGGLGITLPVFDPADPAEVTVASNLTIAYEIVGDEG